LTLYQVLEEPPDSSVLFHNGWGVGVGVGYTLLLEDNTLGTCKELAMKEKIIKK